MKNAKDTKKKWAFLAIMIMALAAVPVIASESSQDTSADYETEYTIILNNTGNGTGYTLTTSALTFTSAANGHSYTIIQTTTNAIGKPITISTGNTDIVIVLKNINLSGSITLQSAVNATILLDGVNKVTAGISVPFNGTLTIDSAYEPGSSKGSITVNSSGDNAAIGGTGGTINILGGTITATNVSGKGAAIGGHGSSTTYGSAGGKILITGNAVVTANSQGGAGIGGGLGNTSTTNPNGEGAVLTIDSTATVFASSWCMYYTGDNTKKNNLPAIHAKELYGTGYFVNTIVLQPNLVPLTTAYNLRIYADGDTGNTLMTALVGGPGWKTFAFQLPGSTERTEYNIYAEYFSGGGTSVYNILRASDNSARIYSINSMTGYYDNAYGAGYGGSTFAHNAGIVDPTLAVKMEKSNITFSSVNEMFWNLDKNVLIQGDNLALFTTPGDYNSIIPNIPGYRVLGYKWNSAPANATDYIPANSVSEVFLSEVHKIIYFVYEEVGTPYVDVMGDTKFAKSVTFADQAYFDSIKSVSDGSYTLNGGWYLVNGQVSLAGVLKINGNVNIVISDGTVFTVGSGITFNTGSNLAVFSQPVENVMGKLNLTGGSVNLGTNSSLTNTAIIDSGTTGPAVSGNGGNVLVVNGVTGVIRSQSYGVQISAGGEICNYGLIGGSIRSIDAGSNAASLVLYNEGTLDGTVKLSNTANSVTFAPGSLINGDFNIGTSPYSTLNFTGTLAPEDNFIYSIVNGTVNLENATVQVSFDSLPSPYNNETIILIDARNGNVTGTPANETFSIDGKNFLLGAKDKMLTATLCNVVNINFVQGNGTLMITDGTASYGTFTSPGGSVLIPVTVTSITITAISDDIRYQFLKLIIGGADIRTSSAVWTIDGDTDIDAYFSDDKDNLLIVSLSQKGGADATLRYTLNGVTYDYILPFTIHITDNISVSASLFGNFEFIRWQTANGLLLSSAPVSDVLSLFEAGVREVELKAVFAETGNRVMVTLTSDPFTQLISYSIDGGTINQYNGAFAMDRNEKLLVSASTDDPRYSFLRWEGPSGIIGYDDPVIDIALPEGMTVTYNAVFVRDGDKLIVYMEQAGNADAKLQYTLNGVTYTYDGSPFAIRKSADSISVSASAYGDNEFVRWQDSIGMIISTSPVSGDLSLADYYSTVTFKAVIAEPGDRVTITLTSDPSGADLYFTIGGLLPIRYTEPFAMDRTEFLTITAAGLSEHDFLRWEGPNGIIGYVYEIEGVTIPTSAASASYNAVFVKEEDKLSVDMTQTGGAGANLQYTLNGVTYDFVNPFVVRKNADILSVSASSYGNYEFIRWADSDGRLISKTSASGNLSLDYGSGITFNAVFAEEGGRVMVTLISDPFGGSFDYIIDGMERMLYAEPFAMDRKETLTVSASNIAYHVFLRWEGPEGIVGYGQETAGINLPLTGASVAYSAVFADPDDILTITLEHNAGAGTVLQYTLNGITYDYVDPFKVKRSDSVSVSVSSYGDYEFIRWKDSLDMITSYTTTVSQMSLHYDSEVTLSAVFATKGNRVTVSLTSDPNGADLWYHIGGLSQYFPYSFEFAMDRKEVLTVGVSFGVSGFDFLRWEGPAGIIGYTETVNNIVLPGTGATASFKAVFVDPTDKLTIILDQTGGAGAKLQYTLNGVTYDFEIDSQVTIRRSLDKFSVSVSEYGDHEFIRWTDSNNIMISATTMSGDLDLSGYGTFVSFTAVFAKPGDRVMVTLISDPNGAVLSYKIDGSAWILYAGAFAMDRNEKLGVKAEGTIENHNFLRWEGPAGIIVYYPESTESIALPENGTSVSYKAVYVEEGDELIIDMEQTGEAGARIQYTLNGVMYTYSGPFTVRQSADVISVSVSSYGDHEFIRWQDGKKILSSTPTSGQIELSGYRTSVTFTAVLAANGDRVTIGLISDPSGAALYFKIGDLDEMLYTGVFVMDRKERLAVMASTMYGDHEFLRWEGPSKIIGITTEVTDIELPGSGDFALFKAVYSLPGDELIVILGHSQDVGSGVRIQYTLNGVTYDYEGPFTIRKGADTLSVAVLSYGSFEFIRWQDSLGNIISTAPVSRDIVLSEYEFEDEVTLTAILATFGNRVMVSLSSDPSGAALYYKIGSLKEVLYEGPFAMAMDRSESLSLRAETLTGYNFLRWEDPAKIIGNKMTVDGITLSPTASVVYFTAVYVLPADELEIVLAYDGGSGVVLKYTLNGVTYDYDGPFNIRKSTDSISVTASSNGGYEFVRWIDSYHNLISLTRASENILLADYQIGVTFTAVFAMPSSIVIITLTSDPAGAPLYFMIGDLNKAVYTVPFAVLKGESLRIGAEDIQGYDFLRWEGSGWFTSNDQEAEIILPQSSESATYEAVYTLPDEQIDITLLQTGDANAQLFYTLNGGEPILYNGVFTISKRDKIAISVSSYGDYEFIRWQDGKKIISSNPTSGEIVLAGYDSEATFTAVLAENGDKVMVTLVSDPSGATLYFTIGGLNEIAYSGSFAMDRKEDLTVRAGTLSGYKFIEWVDEDGTIIGTATETVITTPLSAVGETVFKAIYTLPENELIITLTQNTGQAYVELFYTLNDKTYKYTAPFSVRKGIDTVSLSVASYGDYEFLRWHDSFNTISVTSASGNLDLSVYGSEVIFEAKFSSPGNRVMVTLNSDPSGAALYYTIGELKEMRYTGTFAVAMDRTETLKVRAENTMAGHGFLRWEGPNGIIGYNPEADGIVLSAGTSAVIYTAIFVKSGDELIITMTQTGGTGAKLQYTLNGVMYDYEDGTPFTIRKSADHLHVLVSEYGDLEFIRWQDSYRNIVAAKTVSDCIELDEYVSSATFTAVFTVDGDRVMVTLTSDPSGAAVYYTIGDLKTILYTEPFAMDRKEALSISTDLSLGDRLFLRWEGPNGFITYENDVQGITLPDSGTNAVYKAVFVLPGEMLTITLAHTGKADAVLQYTLNGFTYDFKGAFKVHKGADLLSVSVSYYGDQEFIRWQDGKMIVSSNPTSGEMDLSGYVAAATFTAVLAENGEKVIVALTSDPSGAAIYFKIGGLDEMLYTGVFAMERSEKLTIIADETFGLFEFLRWEGPAGIIGDVLQMTDITLPGSGANAVFTAVYVMHEDKLEITLTQIGGASAKLQYTLNGVTYDYNGSFTIRKSADQLSVSASSYGNFEFIRWQDTEGNVISLTATSGNVDTSVYRTEAAEFKVLFAAQGERVMVTMTSDPNTATLYYTITGLKKAVYTEAFVMAMYEKLTIEAGDITGHSFLRWEGPGGIIGYAQEKTNMDLSEAGTAAEFKAVFVKYGDELLITLDQTGGAGAKLHYTLNGVAYTYEDVPFIIRKNIDWFTLSASSYGDHEFIRWIDSDYYMVSSTMITQEIALMDYGSEVTFTAVFAKSGDRVMVTLTSDPDGVMLHYAVFYSYENSRLIEYQKPFAMDRNEKLMILATGDAQYCDFLRWEGPAGIIGYYRSTGELSNPTTGNAFEYKAVFVKDGDRLEVELEQTGGAGAKLQYILNGVTYDYDGFDYNGKFSVRKSTDQLSVSASSYGSFEGIRWQDSMGNILSSSPVSGDIDLSKYEGGAIFTVVFAKSGDRVFVTLTSDPNGAALYYKIEGLNEIEYTGAFTMSRHEGLTLRTGSVLNYEFLRWEGPSGIFGKDQEGQAATLPSTGVDAAFKAVFVLPGDKLEILMVNIGGGPLANLSYTLNNINYDFTEKFTIRKSTDQLFVHASGSEGQTFIRWQDSLGNVVSGLSSSVKPDLLPYTVSVTFTAVFADDDQVILVYLISDPNGAPLFYTIGGLNEAAYTGYFVMTRSEKLSIRADDLNSYDFLRWESGGKIVTYGKEAKDLNMPGTGNMTFGAVYVLPEDKLEIVLGYAGPTTGQLLYTLNGFTYDYNATPFNVRKSTDQLSLTAYNYGTNPFLRWQDSAGDKISSTPTTGILDLSNYGSAVTFTAVLTSVGNDITVTLTSDPNGAVLYFTISGLNEAVYTGPFTMARSETLTVRAGGHAGYDFLRWEDAGGIFSYEDSSGIILPATGSSASYNAIYVAFGDKLEITLTQKGGADADLFYTLNGVTYSSPLTFTVRKSVDMISMHSSSPEYYDFIRWQDSAGNKVSSAVSTGSLVLSGYESPVTFTAVFAASGESVRIILTSDPNGAALFFTIDGLNEYEYNGSFLMSKTEKLTIRAGGLGGYDFLRWEGPNGIFSYESMEVIAISESAGDLLSFEAVYVSFGDKLEIILTQKGGANATLQYILNGITYDYSEKFTIRKSADVLSLASSGYGDHEFIRWQDSAGRIVSHDIATVAPELSGYKTSVTFTVVFAKPGGSVTVSLTSDPDGAALFYTIEGLNEFAYDGSFLMSRNEKLSIRTETHEGYVFQKWNGPDGVVGSTHAVTGLSLPAAGSFAAYEAIHIIPEEVKPETKYYYITATADFRTAITPEGVIKLMKGDSQTFNFRSAAGAFIGAVIVDGRYLSQEEIDLGYYVFSNVNSNHTIEVLSSISSSLVVLTIDVVKGNGYAEYSINGGPFVLYEKAVAVPEFSNITVRAYADDGYMFKEWRMGTTVITESEVLFSDVSSSLHLDLYFAEVTESSAGNDNSTLIWVAGLIMLFAAACFMTWAAFVRRSYKVVKAAFSAEIIGKDKARRKKAYRFTIMAGSSGTAAYRVGEAGPWKAIAPNENGEYVIPGQEVIDHLTIEYRG